MASCFVNTAVLWQKKTAANFGQGGNVEVKEHLISESVLEKTTISDEGCSLRFRLEFLAMMPQIDARKHREYTFLIILVQCRQVHFNKGPCYRFVLRDISPQAFSS